MAVTQFTISMPDEPGALAHLVSILKTKGVKIKGFMLVEGAEQKGKAVMRMVLSKPEVARALFAENGIGYQTEQLLAVRADDLPQAIDRVSRCLGEAGVNINYLYPLLPRPGGLVLHTSDERKASACLSARRISFVSDADLEG
jgi:hypothetical protein